MIARHLSNRRSLRSLLLASLFLPLTVFSQQVQQKGDASLTLEFQYIETGDFVSSFGRADIGAIDTQVMLFSGTYALTKRWAVMASVPYIRRRYIGVAPHDAVAEFSNFEPPDLTFIDDGSYQSGFQDLYMGVQYRVKDGPISVTPYMYYGTPTNRYHIYGWSAIGRNIWHLPVGVKLAYRPYFSDWYFSSDVAYVFTEKTLGVNISHWLIRASASYYFTPRFAPNIYISIKKSFNGLDFDEEFLSKYLDTETFFLHDRVLKHNYFDAGVGFDWILSDKYKVSGNIFKMVTPDQTNDIEFAASIALTRYFSGGR